MNDTTARVKWELGQTLLPENFVALEDSILAESSLRFSLIGLPRTGVSQLSINDSLLERGIFSVKKITFVMQSGLLLDVPGNSIIEPYNLNLPGKTDVTIYCHILDEKVSSRDLEDKVQDDNITRYYNKLVLSSEQTYSGSIDYFKLIVFEKDPEEIWTISKKYIPPLIQIGASPFLQDDIIELYDLLESFEHDLKLAAATYLTGGDLLSINNLLKCILYIKRLLLNYQNQIHMHPFYFYNELTKFYVEICFYKGMDPKEAESIYDHNNLCKCFSQIINPIKEQIQLNKTKSPYIPFEFQNGIFSAVLHTDIRESNEIYFLIQKDKVNKKISTENLKLASLSRLSFIYKRALQGIPIKKMTQVPFQHSFGPEVEFYKVISGEEWDYALQDLSIAFYSNPKLKEIKFYLYMR